MFTFYSQFEQISHSIVNTMSGQSIVASYAGMDVENKRKTIRAFWFYENDFLLMLPS